MLHGLPNVFSIIKRKAKLIFTSTFLKGGGGGGREWNRQFTIIVSILNHLVFLPLNPLECPLFGMQRDFRITVVTWSSPNIFGVPKM